MDRRDFLKFCGGALAALGLRGVPTIDEGSGWQHEPICEPSDREVTIPCGQTLSFMSGDCLKPGDMVYASQYGSISRNPIGHPWIGVALDAVQSGEIVRVAVSGRWV